MKYNDGNYILSTGRDIYANCGFIGINNEMELSEGYDGGFTMPEDDWIEFEYRLTNAECVEIAEYMIGQWQKFREKYSE